MILAEFADFHWYRRYSTRLRQNLGTQKFVVITICVKFNDCARTRPRIGTTTINTTYTNEMNKPSARRGNKGKSKSSNKRGRDDQEHNDKIKR